MYHALYAHSQLGCLICTVQDATCIQICAKELSEATTHAQATHIHPDFPAAS